MKQNNQLLDVHRISKNYKKKTVFENITFSMTTGDWLGFIGKNGSGKSTLAAILVGIDQQYSGEIFFQEANQKDRPLKKWVQDIQLITQYTRNALDPSKFIMDILKEPLKQFQLGDKETWEDQIFHALSDCYLDKDILKKKPQQLSGGQYQRVCIAQALLVQPKILICDEITANLDKINELRIMKLLKSNKKLTVIFISHNRKLVEIFCDRFLYMEEYK